MVFPATPLDLVAELFLSGAWVDVTSAADPAARKVFGQDGITITRGRSDEARHVDPSTCKLTLDNTDGRFSPRNPTGPYYGQLGRNTPLRVAVRLGGVRMLVPASPAALASTPDSVGLSITGDIDVRLDAAVPQWNSVELMGKWADTSNQRGWALILPTSGRLRLSWSSLGTDATIRSAEATADLPRTPHGRISLRATLDVDNGAGGCTVTFYTSTTAGVAGPWTQLGAPVVAAGTTAIFDNTTAVQVGHISDGFTLVAAKEVYAAEIRQGIAGTVRASPDFTAQASGATSFADAQSNTWTVAGGASLTDRRYRFWGEVSEWPQKWDITGHDARTAVTASGILRRLSQGASPLKSVLYRALTTLVTPAVAYWPAEDGSAATRIASALGGPAMTVRGTPTYAAHTAFKASAPLPTLGSSQWRGTVPTYTVGSPAAVQVRFLLAVPAGGATNGQAIASVWTSGTVSRWKLQYDTGGALRLLAYDHDQVSVLDSGPVAFAVNGKLLRVSVELAQNGTGVDWNMLTLEVGAETGLSSSGTLATNTISRALAVEINADGNLGSDVAVGHISVQKAITSLYDLHAELDAYAGETAGRRIQRLCGEEGIAVTLTGNLDDTAAMGAQGPDTLVDLLREAAEADLGILHEPRDALGLAYRTRGSLYNQSAALELNYAAGHADLDPVDDDQGTRNDVTVTRKGGSSARAELATGALSVQAPPNGVGRYDEAVTVNVETDAVLADQAGWRRNLGTVDEARYPKIEVDPASTALSVAFKQAVLELDVGDRLTVTGLPAFLPPDAVSQLVQGHTEHLTLSGYRTELNCSPESPWRVGVYNAASRYSPDSSTLSAGVTSSATSLSVATPSGPVWTVDGAQMPFTIRVGGEVMTVTAISGAASPQTFTVTRSVNGVVKAHSAGAAVALDQPARYAL